MKLTEISKSVLTSCMDVKAGENVLILTDDNKFGIGNALYESAKELGADAMLMTMKPRNVSGEEPPPAVAAAMKAADVVLCPMSTSITHTTAKIEAAKSFSRGEFKFYDEKDFNHMVEIYGTMNQLQTLGKKA